MATTVGDFLLQRLAEWGVRRVFGYPGDGINGIVGAFGRQDQIEFVQPRHEEMAAFMATAHAKFTGETGVCLATSGPGAIHLLNGLYDAKLDHQPVVAIVGQQQRMAMGGDYQQEVDLLSLFKDVAHEYVHMATDAAQVRHLIDRAMRIAREQRTVTCIIFPNDVQDLPAVPKPPREHGSVHSGIGALHRSLEPPLEALRQAADILNSGKKVAILAGAGALAATDELISVAEILGAGIAKALLGKAAVPDDLPYVTGSIGLLGTKPSHDMMNGCDTLLMVGSSFPYAEYLPKEGQARGVQIDIDARLTSLRYPMECSLVGDARATLRALIPLLERKQERGWQQQIEENTQRWWQVLEARAMNEADPVNPQRVFWELSSRLPDKSIITCDSGSSANWYARDVKLRRGMMASLSGGLATMGPAVPYAIAAKFAWPDRPVIALAGDGAMQMNGINGLITVARLWPQWRDPRLVVMVLNNGDLNLVTWEARAMGGDPRYAPSQGLPDFPYAAYGELLGLKGIRVSRPEDVGPAWDAALAADRPCVLEMVTDPNVPPLPPDVSLKQAGAYVSALLKGDPDSIAIVKATIKETWDSWFPPAR
ncbi:thiamine pyrophosphate-requiring protein [Pseudoduganella namucuonensis]|uniref:Pyruvate dehydrogenase (Quinone) n=1 Tax=Pseudoduganella namucuonensis TaxID=1035707 RepID=A0A1I7JDW6_9BURK|nr:thiamine pyrophosphate-requiring protein [Pseudoduganella namucuonensis]SFU83385.1 pyruvate dehydrogenase (quinone) [Pseudoduganella namucuonensis]